MSSEQAMVLLTGVSILVAILAGIVSVRAWRAAKDSVAEARTANTLADRANRLSGEANEIARSAVAHAKGAATDVAWDEMLAAVGLLQSFDAASNSRPVDSLLTNLRIRAIQLVDRLDWDGFDKWAMREHQLGLLLMREAADLGRQASPLTVDQVLEINKPFHTWVAGYTLNLRRFRATGPLAQELSQLTERARQLAHSVTERNGWEPPPDDIPGLERLDVETD